MSFRSSQVIGSFPTIDVGDTDHISVVKPSDSIEMSKLRNKQKYYDCNYRVLPALATLFSSDKDCLTSP